MKNIKRLIYYIADYKGSIVLYFVCSLLAVVFSLFSMGSLMPVLQVLFSGDEKPKPKANPNIVLVIAGEFYEDKQPYFDLIEKYQIQNQRRKVNQIRYFMIKNLCENFTCGPDGGNTDF